MPDAFLPPQIEEVEKEVQDQMRAALEQARVTAAAAGGGPLPPHLPINPNNQQFTTFMDAMASSSAGQQMMAMVLDKRAQDMNINP